MKGVPSKINSLRNFVHASDLKVICITESHLNSAISTSFVSIPHFSLLRNDVQGKVYKHGVCAYIHEDILVDSVSFPMSNVLLFRLVKQDVFIMVVYRPPSYSDLKNEALVHALWESIPGKEIIVVGDFNLPSIHWKLPG